MNIKLLIVFFVSALVGCAQTPTATKSVDTAVSQEEKGNEGAKAVLLASNGKGKVVCRYEKASGSNIRQRVCMSAEERARLSENTKEFLNRIQQQPTPTRD